MPDRPLRPAMPVAAGGPNIGRRRLADNAAVDRALVGHGEASALRYHQSWPNYEATPLRAAPTAAAVLGVASVLVKDESGRLGMPSFKILGASWATHRALCEHVGADPGEVPDIDALRTLSAGRDLTLVAATDGNHGRAVARMARLLGLRARILVPLGMAPARIAALEDENAVVSRVPGGYDVAVAASALLADSRHLVISDTSWDGYHAIPGWVIDGYSTLTSEIECQRTALGAPPFSIVGVQVGVGAFAAAIARAFRDRAARLIGVEPTAADCVLASIEAGERIALSGLQDSIMAGLNCGTPSPVAWPDVRHGIDTFAAIEDDEAEAAMRILAADGIVSGESGAAGLAGLLAFRDELGLSTSDQVLVVSTEGATDPLGYARAVGHPPEITRAGAQLDVHQRATLPNSDREIR